MHHSRQVATIFAIAMPLLGASPAGAQVLNPSFETTTGLTINNWTQTGNVGFLTSAFGKTPTNGSKMAYLVSQNGSVPGITSTPKVTAAALATALGTTTTALNTAAGAGHSVTTGAGATGGSGISQNITVTAGQTLRFDWDFLTTEDTVAGGNHNDFGFVSINGVVTVLGRPDQIASDPTDFSAFHYIPFSGGAVDGSNVQTYLFDTGNGTGNAGNEPPTTTITPSETPRSVSGRASSTRSRLSFPPAERFSSASAS